MAGFERSMRLLALVALLGGCAEGSGDAEMEAAEAPMEVPAPDISGFDQDSDGLLADAEWTAYLTEQLPWHVWDVDQSAALEESEFSSGAVAAAPDATFTSWDADQSGGVDANEWAAAWLRIYDKDTDGKVSAEELRPA